MRATSEKYRLNSYDGEELPFENYMKLDNQCFRFFLRGT